MLRMDFVCFEFGVHFRCSFLAVQISDLLVSEIVEFVLNIFLKMI